MALKHPWRAGFGLAFAGYVLGAAMVAFVLPKSAERAVIAEVDHVHISASEAEPLVGRFGVQGERHPAAAEFATLEAGLTERRRQTMRAMSGHFRVISAAIFSGAGGEDNLQHHADALALMGAQIHTLFEFESPTAQGQPGALPAIWQEPERFDLFTAAFREEAAEFAQTVRTEGDVMNGLHDLRYYCVACHANFRQR